MDEGFVEGGGDISIGKVYSIFSAQHIVEYSSKEYLAVVDEGGGGQNQDSCFHLPVFLKMLPCKTISIYLGLK